MPRAGIGRVPELGHLIPAKAFYCHDKLESLALPEGVTSIGAAAFSHCGLEKIVIPESVKMIRSAAFEQCPARESVRRQAEARGAEVVWQDNR